MLIHSHAPVTSARGSATTTLGFFVLYLYTYISPYNLTVYIMVPWPVRKILTFRGELLAKSYKLKGQK